jgi:hypothetical protein
MRTVFPSKNLSALWLGRRKEYDVAVIETLVCIEVLRKSLLLTSSEFTNPPNA